MKSLRVLKALVVISSGAFLLAGPCAPDFAPGNLIDNHGLPTIADIIGGGGDFVEGIGEDIWNLLPATLRANLCDPGSAVSGFLPDTWCD